MCVSWWGPEGWGPEGWSTKFRRVPAFKNTTKIPREDPQREKKKTKWVRERKKRAKFGAVRRWSVAQGGPREGGPNQQQPQQPTPTTTQHKNGLAKMDWPKLAKPLTTNFGGDRIWPNLNHPYLTAFGQKWCFNVLTALGQTAFGRRGFSIHHCSEPIPFAIFQNSPTFLIRHDLGTTFPNFLLEGVERIKFSTNSLLFKSPHLQRRNLHVIINITGLPHKYGSRPILLPFGQSNFGQSVHVLYCCCG